MSQDHNNEDLDRYFNDPEYRRKQLEKRKQQSSSTGSFNLKSRKSSGTSSKADSFNLKKESSEDSTPPEDQTGKDTFESFEPKDSEAERYESSASSGSGDEDISSTYGNSGYDETDGGSSHSSSPPPPDQPGGNSFGFGSFGGGKGGVTWGQLLYGFGILVLIGLVSGGIFFIYLIQGLPSLEELENPRTDMASFVMSRDGEVLDQYFTENRRAVRYDEISSHVIDALIATEDHRYYGHWGMDMYRTLSIPYHILRGDPQGGSTISQQLARNLYRQIGREVSVRRKLREIITAVQIERNYTKKEIIEMYLNTVEFSNSAYGIETAALTHFNKPASDLNIVEAATLIGSLKAVSMYNPRTRPDNARSRRNVVLALMTRHGFINAEDYQALRDQEIVLDYNPPFRQSQQTRYFGAYVRQQVSDWAEANGYDLERDGLVIHTTIDSRMQQHAQRALDNQVQQVQSEFERVWTNEKPFDELNDRFPRILESFIQETDTYREKVADGSSPDDALDELKTNEAFVDSLMDRRYRVEGGFVGIDPATGHVLTWVGGTDYGQIQRDNVYQSRRQTGSTFKPFVYAVAIDNGYRPHHRFSSYPISFFDDSGARWSPRDPPGATYDDQMTLRDALARSSNNVTVRLLPELAGNPGTNRLEELTPAVHRIADLAEQMGFRGNIERYPSIVLGTAEASLLEMTSAYATFANQGVYIEPMAIERIEDSDGNILAEFQSQHQEEVMNPETAYYVLDMMREVIRSGTGISMRWRVSGFDQDMAGKTGTTARSADAWFVGMTPQIVMGSWIGGEDRRIRFPQGSQVGQGSRSALPVVARFVNYAKNDNDVNWSTEAFQQPQGFIMEVEDDDPREEDDSSPIAW